MPGHVLPNRNNLTLCIFALSMQTLVSGCVVGGQPVQNADRTSALRSAERISERPAIIGGDDVTDWAAVSFQVGIIRSFSPERLEDSGLVCGGTLIEDRWVLTAAHCLYDQTMRLYKKTDLVVYLGSPELPQDGIAGMGERTAIQQLIPHELYKPAISPGPPEYDIALIELAAPAPANVKHLALPTLAENAALTQPDKQVSVLGWGYTSEQCCTTAKLQIGTMSIQDIAVCRQKYADRIPGLNIPADMICAGSPNIGSCHYDSGGFLGANQNGRWTQIAIIGWGLRCVDPSYPEVYTSVAKYIDWIRTTSGQTANVALLDRDIGR